MAELIDKGAIYDDLANRLTWLMTLGDEVYLLAGGDIRDVIDEQPTTTEEEIRNKAIDEFANFLHQKAKEYNGLRLSSETRSWTHPCIFDYVKEFGKEQLKLSGNSEQQNGWILVEERLPEDKQEVWLTFKNSAGLHVGEATYQKNMFFYVAEIEFGYYEEVYKCPIAWKTKDKPYQKGE